MAKESNRAKKAMASGYNSIKGTDTANTLIASDAVDSIQAFAADDTVTNVHLKDIVDLGIGDDTLTVKAIDGIYSASITGGIGKDSITFDQKSSYTTVKGGQQDDDIYLYSDANFGGNYIYGDLGNDTLELLTLGIGDRVQGGNTTDATSADGDDSIYVAKGAYNAFIHGNGGNDTLSIYVAGEVSDRKSSVYGGQGEDSIHIRKEVKDSYITGNLGNDTITLRNIATGTTGKLDGATIFGGGGYLVDTSNDGNDSITIYGLEGITNGTLIHGNGGHDTILATGVGSLTNEFTNTIDSSSIYGGQGDDSISALIPGGGQKFKYTIANTLLSGNRGNDTLNIAGVTKFASIYGGSGDNYINFGYGFDADNAPGSNGNHATYFYGSETGNDTLNFERAEGGLDLTVAVDETLGNPNTFTFNTDQKTVTLGSGKTLYISGYTGSSINDINSLGLTFKTVSSTAITLLG